MDAIKNISLQIVVDNVSKRKTQYEASKQAMQPYFMEDFHIGAYGGKINRTIKQAFNNCKYKDKISRNLDIVLPMGSGLGTDGFDTWTYKTGNDHEASNFTHALSDFINSVIFRSLYENKRPEELFNSEWSMFITELTQWPLRGKFIVPVLKLWYDCGAAPEKVFEGSGFMFSGYWDDNVFYSTKLKLDNAFQDESVWNETERNRMLLVKEFEISHPSDDIGKIAFNTLVDAKKAIYPLQLVHDASVHIDCVIPYFVGNYTTTHLTILKNYFDHRSKYEYGRKLDYYDQEELRKVGYILNQINENDRVFTTNKLAHTATRLNRDPSYDWSSYRDELSVLTPYLEKIVDLIQVLESTIGDLGKFNADYLIKVLGKRPNRSKQYLHDLFELMYDIRNKYIHAQIYGNNSLYDKLRSKYINNNLINFDLLSNDIDLFSYHVKKAAYLKILNPSIKEKTISYHISQKDKKGKNLRYKGNSVDVSLLRNDLKSFPRLKRILGEY